MGRITKSNRVCELLQEKKKKKNTDVVNLLIIYTYCEEIFEKITEIRYLKRDTIDLSPVKLYTKK